MCSKEEVFGILISNPKGNKGKRQFKNRFPELYQEIISISFPVNFKWTQKLYHFFHDDFEFKLGVCPVCGAKCSFKSFTEGYHVFCSKLCGQKSEITKQKRENTCIKLYGVKNPFQSEEKKQKIRETNMSRYGVSHPMYCDEIKNRLFQTNYDKYGIKCTLHTPENEEKVKQTNIERYGCENGGGSAQALEKIKQTCLDKYGTECYFSSDDFKGKMDEYLTENGVINVFQMESVKEKSRQTCQERYGVDNYAQTHEYASKRHKRIEYDDMFFDSSWELILYQYCEENNITCEYQPNIQFEYEYEGKKHVYQPDFIINDQIYEVKGDQFFEGDKMICPFDRTKDGLFESKHQCMIQNNIIILRRMDIEKIMLGENIFE